MLSCSERSSSLQTMLAWQWNFAPNGDLFKKVRDAKGLAVSSNLLCSSALEKG